MYHIGRHLPSWFRGMAPKTALEVHEESWNAYPYTKTKFSVPFVDKFMLEVDTVFQPDAGTQVRSWNQSKNHLSSHYIHIVMYMHSQMQHLCTKLKVSINGCLDTSKALQCLG